MGKIRIDYYNRLVGTAALPIAVRVGPDLDHCPDHPATAQPVQMNLEGL